MKQFDSLVDNETYAKMYQISVWNSEIMGREIKKEAMYELNNTQWLHELNKQRIEPEMIIIQGASAEGKMLVKVFAK